MPQSNPGLAYNQVPTAAQWNSYFTAKQDWSATLDAIIQAGGAPTVTAPASWTPTDASGAALVLPTSTVTATKLGNVAFVSGQITFPTTASTAAAAIGGLPVPVPPPYYGKCPSIVFSNAGVEILALTIPGTSTFQLMAPVTGTAITNAALSGRTFNFSISYPAT